MKQMSNQELKRVAEAIDKYEHSFLKSWGLHRLSGGFCHLDMVGYDDNEIDLECKSGVQNDVENDVTVESFRMDRKSLTIIN